MAAPDLPPFDTQQAAEKLREHGFGQQQADAIVRADVMATANLATRADLDAGLETLKNEMLAAMDKQTSELRVELQKAINGQTWRFIAALGVLLGLLRWLVPPPVS